MYVCIFNNLFTRYKKRMSKLFFFCGINFGHAFILREKMWVQSLHQLRTTARNAANDGEHLTSTLTFLICRLTRENSCCRVWGTADES